MSQPPADPFRRQPPGAQPPGPQRPRGKRLRKRSVALLAIGAILLLMVIVGVADAMSGKPGNHGLSAASSAAARAATTAEVKKSAIAKAERACGARPPASRDIYVRIIKPGASPEVRQLGGKWRWDHATGHCLTAVHFMTATAPRSAGHCTQVGYVTDNRGYDPNATPAPPLPQIAAKAGPACAAAVASPPTPAPPVQTTPAAAAPTPAPTTPAGCTPLSDEGTCYKPGEYCRDDDHGDSGVAGDGEAIICEYNDGWRWEPS
jgi:hypothetical protein